MTKQIDIHSTDFEIVICSAVRYALGRRSYVPNWLSFLSKVQSAIKDKEVMIINE